MITGVMVIEKRECSIKVMLNEMVLESSVAVFFLSGTEADQPSRKETSTASLSTGKPEQEHPLRKLRVSTVQVFCTLNPKR